MRNDPLALTMLVFALFAFGLGCAVLVAVIAEGVR